jgi:hypothetical protein
LNRIEQLAATGDIEESERQLQSFRRMLPQPALTALRAWLYTVKMSLDEFGAWGIGTQEPEKTRCALLDNISTAYAALDPAAMIQQVNSIAAHVRGWMTLTVPGEVARIFRAASADLSAGTRPETAAAVAACANDVSTLHVDDPLAALNFISAVRRRAEDAMRAGIPPNAALDARLAEGNFLNAVALIALPPATVTIRPSAAATPGAAIDRLPRQSAALPSGDVAPAPPRLLLPSDLTIGQTIPLTIDWTPAQPAALTVTWTCQPAGAADVTTSPGASAAVTPRRPGFLTIVASIAGYPDITAKSYVGSVLQTPDFAALQKRVQRLKLTTWAMTAVLTTGVGFQIFTGNWLGTPSDFVSAFIWGFFGQFGLDRIRDLARPVTGKVMS